MIRLLMIALLTLLTTLAAPAPAQNTSEPEVWTGAAQLPGGAELAFTLNITRGESPSATIDIPSQGAMGVPLQVASLEGNSYVLRIPAPANAEIAGTINDEGDLAGVLKQAGMEFPFKLERSTAEAAGPKRPQTPRPPFPYDAIEVTFENPETEGVTLAGTLTIPEGEGPFPAVVTATGSGPQDRDETLMGHKPFAVLADFLSRRGIAVLRVDDRGVAQSTGDFQAATTDDFASDARAAVRFLTERRGIDAERIGILGHSEGGLVAPMAAVGSEDVAFVVLLAGTTVDGGEILVSQQGAITRGMGAPEQAVATVQESMRAMVDALRAGDDEAAIEALRDVLAAQNPGAGPEQVDQIVQSQRGFFLSPWMKRFVELDPAEYLTRLDVPVLALFGERDVQVLPEVNVEPLDAALASAPTDDVTILVLEGHNHLFQRATTGMASEYAQIEETMSEKTLGLIASWIGSRFGE
jgi:hypothetical protein